VQIIVAGKAHPHDTVGKAFVHQWAAFASRADVRARAVFLEDYDLALAQMLVQGVDVWINTPRRPWEACGTSGMKVLVNGGLNLSSLDGWWAEAYSPELGWAIGDRGADDETDAQTLYRLLEEKVIPEFHERDADGVPQRWVARMRASMSRLAPQFSSNRMLMEYVQEAYQPAARMYRERAAAGGALAVALAEWGHLVRHRWHDVHVAEFEVRRDGDLWNFRAHVYLGDMPGDAVAVQIYADATGHEDGIVVPMERGAPLPGAINSYVYTSRVASARPATDFTPRVIPHHPKVRWPLELPLVHWRGG
jgi:starch phosphorylase